MKQNNVANLLMIIGIMIFVLGGGGGLIAGEGFVVIWLSSFISGMFFIALAEIIELIDTKLTFANERLSNLESLLKSSSMVDESVIEYIQEEKTPTKRDELKKPILTNEESQFIKKFYQNKQMEVLNIIKSPIEDHCLVELENGEHEIVELGGFKPIVKNSEEWEPELRRWYEGSEYK